MKITKQLLKQLIKEELSHVLSERGEHRAPEPMTADSGRYAGAEEYENWSGNKYQDTPANVAHSSQARRGGVTGAYRVRNRARLVKAELKKANAALATMEEKAGRWGGTDHPSVHEEEQTIMAALRKALAFMPNWMDRSVGLGV